MNELSIISILLPIIIPVLLGRLIVWVRLLEPKDAKPITILFLNVFLPPLTVGLLAPEDFSSLLHFRFILANLILLVILYAGLLVAHALLLRRSLDISAIAADTGSHFNAGVIGLPILLGTIGHHAIVPTAVNFLMVLLLLVPLTIFLLNFSISDKTQQNSLGTLMLSAFKQAATNPIVIATAIGLCLSAGEIQIPKWLNNTLQTLGSGTSATALIAVGMTLSITNIRQHFGEVICMSAVRVILSPIIAIGIAKGLNLPPVFAIALVISFSLPTGKVPFTLAETYGVYKERAAGIVSTTTLAFIITLPMIIWLCDRLWPGVINLP